MQHATLRTFSYTLKTGCALTIKNHQCTTTSKIFLHFEDLGIYNLLMSITDKEVFKDYYKLDIENPIIRINTAFKGCSSLEKISVLPRIYHN